MLGQHLHLPASSVELVLGVVASGELPLVDLALAFLHDLVVAVPAVARSHHAVQRREDVASDDFADALLLVVQSAIQSQRVSS